MEEPTSLGFKAASSYEHLDREDRYEEALLALVADTPNPWWPEGEDDDDAS